MLSNYVRVDLIYCENFCDHSNTTHYTRQCFQRWCCRCTGSTRLQRFSQPNRRNIHRRIRMEQKTARATATGLVTSSVLDATGFSAPASTPYHSRSRRVVVGISKNFHQVLPEHGAHGKTFHLPRAQRSERPIFPIRRAHMRAPPVAGAGSSAQFICSCRLKTVFAGRYQLTGKKQPSIRIGAGEVAVKAVRRGRPVSLPHHVLKPWGDHGGSFRYRWRSLAFESRSSRVPLAGVMVCNR